MATGSYIYRGYHIDYLRDSDVNPDQCSINGGPPIFGEVFINRAPACEAVIDTFFLPGVPIITYVTATDLGNGRIWVEYGVQGKGNVKITIDGAVVGIFYNPHDSYTYGDVFPVTGGRTYEVCVVGF